MALLPITLGLSGLSDTAGGSTAGSSAFSGDAGGDAVRQAAHERDGHTCQYCGFVSRKYQLTRLKEGKGVDPTKAENHITTCIFCDQCFSIDQVATMKSGVLIWLPEIDQATLHHVARSIYVARISQGPIADAARKALEFITSRREEAKNRIKTDDPSILSLVMRDYVDPAAYKRRGEKLDGIRLFPLDRRIISEGDLEFNQFPQILAYWRSKDGPFGNWQPAQWIEDFKALRAA